MLEQRWITIRDHQAGLLAEAEAERLVRRAREARANDGSSSPDDAALAKSEARGHGNGGQRLAAVAAGLSADARLSPCECPEA